MITGPAGGGKTTLCYCLTGVIPHFLNGCYRGSVKVSGQSLAELRLPEIAGLVGFVLQRPENQLFSLTVREDVAFGPENLCLDPHKIRARINTSLAFAGMEAFAGRSCSTLSGGEAQRVVLSSILAMEPDLFVLDQPAAELDPLGRKQIYDNIYRLIREAGKTVIMIEDRLTDILPHASRIILINEGQIVKNAPPEEFFADESVLSYGIRVPDSVKLHYLLKNTRFALTRLCITPQDIENHLKPLIGLAKFVGPARAPEDNGETVDCSAASTVVQVQDLSFRYPNSDRWALEDVCLDFRRGEFTAIIGENGAGKTTLAKHLIGLLRPTRGKVVIDGRDISSIPTACLSDTVGYLFQDPDLQIFCNSVFDEVAFGLKVRKVPRDRIAILVNETLRKLGLSSLSECHPYLLSRGQRQRLALAAILVHRPQVLVVDEPSTGLDYRETIEIMNLLTEFCDDGGIVLMITHDMEMVVRYAERSIVMARGRVLTDTATKDIGKHLDALTQAAIELPDLHHLVRSLDLPPACRDIEEVIRLLAESRT